ncbi:MAG: hypothetical protein JNK72_24695 [Myxococcales bacterium]|nr:hypothetical protein [Myxococcales bacterium]
MATEKKLVAASVNASAHARYATPTAVAAAGTMARLEGQDVQVRLHIYDPALARILLARLRSERFDEATLNALPPSEQHARLVEFHKTLSGLFRALNLSPYGIEPYRVACERAWGFPGVTGSGDAATDAREDTTGRDRERYWQGKPNRDKGNGNWRGSWRTRAWHVVARRWAAAYSGALPAAATEKSAERLLINVVDGRIQRMHALDRAMNRALLDHPDLVTSVYGVVFGWDGQYRMDNAGAINAQPGRAPAPTVEQHRFFFQENGAFWGGYEVFPEGTPPDNEGLQASWGTTINQPLPPRLAASGGRWAGASIFTTDGVEQPPPGLGRPIVIARAAPDVVIQGNDTGTGFTADHVDLRGRDVRDWRVGVFDLWKTRCWVQPPLKWYWDVWRGPMLPEGYTGAEPTFPEAQGPRSILDWMAGVAPYDLVRTVFLQCIRRNQQMATMHSATVADIATGQTAAQGLHRAETQRLDDIQEDSAIASSVGGLLMGTGSFTLGIGPLLGGATSLVSAIVAKNRAGQSTASLRKTDVFGRLWPSFEGVTIADSLIAYESAHNAALALTAEVEGGSVESVAARTGPLQMINPLLWGQTDRWVSNIDAIRRVAMRPSELLVEGLPPYTPLEWGEARQRLSGEWTSTAQTTYRVFPPLGRTEWLRALTQGGGRERMVRIGTAIYEPTRVGFSDMVPVVRWEIDGVPHGLHIEVDGSLVPGTWLDAGLTRWVAWIPEGQHEVVFHLPGDLPAFRFPVRAEGEVLRATFAELVAFAAAIAQREAAMTGGGGAPIVTVLPPESPAPSGVSPVVIVVGGLVAAAAAAGVVLALRAPTKAPATPANDALAPKQ